MSKIGAALTHLINGEGFQVLRPLIFMVFLTLVVYLRRPWAVGIQTERVRIGRAAHRSVFLRITAA
jgi:hypothetical protein